MPKQFFRPPNNFIREWPEVFEDMYINTMPVTYIEIIRMEFNDGRVWEINVKDQLINLPNDIIASKLFETLQDYKDDIKKIDFEFDIERLKSDITKQSKDIF